MLLARSLGICRRAIAAGVLLSAVCVASLGVAQTDQKSRFALVIGNGAYEHIRALPTPPNDAEDVSDKLRQLGFAVTTAIDQTLEEARETIAEFAEKSYGAEIALVYYAGHGMQVEGENYILTVDAQPGGSQWLEEQSLSASELREIFDYVRPDLALLILDACRDNPYVGQVAERPGLVSGTPDRGHEGAGNLIAFAAEPGKVAIDNVDGNSPFTKALLQYIDQPNLEIGLLFREVRVFVMTLTEGKQVPWVEDSLVESFYFRSEPAIAAVGVGFTALLNERISQIDDPLEKRLVWEFMRRAIAGVASEGQPLVPAAFSPQEEGTVDWDDPATIHAGFSWLPILDSKNPADFERFIQRFPDSPFSELARSRLAALQAPVIEPPPDEEEPAPEVDVADEAPEPEAPAAAEVSSDDSEAADDLAIYAAAEEGLALDRGQRMAVQRLLAELGHYGGSLDGDIGPRSRSAVQAFQAEAGLAESSYVDPETLRALTGSAASAALRGNPPQDQRDAIHQLAAIAEFGAGAEPEVILVASYIRFQDVLDYWRRLADAFEAEHPGTRIEFDIRQPVDYREQLLAMLAAAKPPDIFVSWGGGHLRALVDARFARDLTEDMGVEWATSFKPSALTNLVFDDHVFAVPARMTLVSLWANRQKLDVAGVAVEDLATWDGLLASVQKLKEAGITPISLGADEGWPASLYWSGLALGIGGRGAMDAALAGTADGFSGTAFVEAGERLRSLVMLEPFQDRFLEMNENQSIGVFTDGYSAMLLNGDWVQARLMRTWKSGNPEEEVVRIPFPPQDLSDDDTFTTLGGVGAWVVRAGAPDLAVDFLRGFAGTEAQRTLAEMGFGIPTIASADDAIDDPMQQDIATILTTTEYHQLFLDQLLGPVAGEVVNDAIVDLVSGAATPEAAAAAIETAWAPFRDSWGLAGDAEEASTDDPAPPLAAE